MKKLFPLLLILIATANFSCKKNVETDAEKLWNTLQSVIRTENVARILPIAGYSFDPSNITIIGDYGTVYSFNAPMLTIGNGPWVENYNLNTMASYQVATVSSYKCLVLKFR